MLEVLKRVAETHGLKLGDAMQPIRVALTGSTVSEPVNELLAVVGRERQPPRSESRRGRRPARVTRRAAVGCSRSGSR